MELRNEDPAVLPGYPMKKPHSNALALEGSLPPVPRRDPIDHSYALVVAGLPARERARLT